MKKRYTQTDSRVGAFSVSIFELGFSPTSLLPMRPANGFEDDELVFCSFASPDGSGDAVRFVGKAAP